MPRGEVPHQRQSPASHNGRHWPIELAPLAHVELELSPAYCGRDPTPQKLTCRSVTYRATSPLPTHIRGGAGFQLYHLSSLLQHRLLLHKCPPALACPAASRHRDLITRRQQPPHLARFLSQAERRTPHARRRQAQAPSFPLPRYAHTPPRVVA